MYRYVYKVYLHLPLTGYPSSITFAPQSKQVFSNLSHNSVNAIATRVHCWMRFDGDQNAPNAALQPSLCPLASLPLPLVAPLLSWAVKLLAKLVSLAQKHFVPFRA